MEERTHRSISALAQLLQLLKRARVSFAVHGYGVRLDKRRVRVRVVVERSRELLRTGRRVALGLGCGVVPSRHAAGVVSYGPAPGASLFLCWRLLALQLQAAWDLTRPGATPRWYSFH